MLICVYECCEIMRIKTHSPSNLYERNPPLPDPAVEGRNGHGEVLSGFADRQKPLASYRSFAGIELCFVYRQGFLIGSCLVLELTPVVVQDSAD